eukprot:3750980-Amphidinium_carterae.1
MKTWTFCTVWKPPQVRNRACSIHSTCCLKCMLVVRLHKKRLIQFAYMLMLVIEIAQVLDWHYPSAIKDYRLWWILQSQLFLRLWTVPEIQLPFRESEESCITRGSENDKSPQTRTE